MLDPTIAWITSRRALETPFGADSASSSGFRSTSRRSRRSSRRAASAPSRSRSAGSMSIPRSSAPALALKGDASATLVLTRVAGQRVALLAERL